MTVALKLHSANVRTFTKEQLTPQLWAEILPLIVEHQAEVATFPDIPLNPSVARYEAVSRAGILRVFTVRDDSRVLRGYATFLVLPDLHYSTSLQASLDILYMQPVARGFTSIKFLRWCDEQLANEGVQVINHHTRPERSFAKLLERQGYQLTNVMYSKKLY